SRVVRKHPSGVSDREGADLAVVPDRARTDFVAAGSLEPRLPATLDRTAHLARANVGTQRLRFGIERVHVPVLLRSRERQKVRDLGLQARGRGGFLDEALDAGRAQIVPRGAARALSLH